MTLAGFLAYALALGIAVAIPGPGVVALVARALGSGFGHAMAFVAGIILGDLAYLAAAAFGLAVIAEMLGEVFIAVRYGAALYLAYLAYRLCRSAGDMARINAMVADRPLASFTAGFTVTLGNPKTIVFYLALLPTLFDLAEITSADFAILVALTTLVLLTVMTPYAALASRARNLLKRPSTLARLHRCAALILAGAAAWTVLRRA